MKTLRLQLRFLIPLALILAAAACLALALMGQCRRSAGRMLSHAAPWRLRERMAQRAQRHRLE
jgi:hypothetical protein